MIVYVSVINRKDVAAMTNEEVIARMWEAYKAGIEHCNGKDGQMIPERHRSYFDTWLANSEHFPELLEEDNPYQYITVEQAINLRPVPPPSLIIREGSTKVTEVEAVIASKRSTIYWHEFGCLAPSTTPSGVGLCKCDGKHPDGHYDHDYECKADKFLPVGGENCSCITRRLRGHSVLNPNQRSPLDDGLFSRYQD